MALYQNGILISGANTLPQMTLAEYQALPVSERPTYWERTDLNYSNIPASDVTYGSGSVKDALDGLNIELNVNVQYTNSNITIGEYFRYHRFGKMVVVDIGGMRTSDTSQQAIETSNLPIMRTRPVVIIFSDRPGSAQDHGFLYGEIGYRHFTVSIPNTTMYFYGQFIYFTD